MPYAGRDSLTSPTNRRSAQAAVAKRPTRDDHTLIDSGFSLKFIIILPLSSLQVRMSSQSALQSVVIGGVEMSLSGVLASTLKSWYQDYAAQDGSTIHRQSIVVQTVESDVLDYERIEAQVQQLMPTAGVIDGFCAKCRRLLDHWPIFPTGTIRDGTVGKRFYTNEVDAAAREGCIFCALVLSEMRDQNVLDTFRKIEVRLRDVSDSGSASLSIFEPEKAPHNSQVIWIEFPMLRPAAPTICFVSDILPPSGELEPE